MSVEKSLKRTVQTLLVAFLVFALGFSILNVYAATDITNVSTPPADLGTVQSGETVALTFNATITDSTQTLAEITVNYDTTGWSYEGFEAYMDGTDVASNFTVTTDTGTIRLKSDDIMPQNGELSITLTFTALPVEGTYTFSWEYYFGATPPSAPGAPPTLPIGEEESGTSTATITVVAPPPPPAADFYANVTSGDEPLTVQFYDNSTNFLEKTSWFWDFGDGTNSTEQNPVHTYTQDGVYTVKLNVTGTDLDGNPAEASTTKASYITVLDTEPIADFTATPTSGSKPLTVAFYDNSTSNDGIVAWEWDFGDGDTSNDQNPTHTYTEAGTYTVKLTVTEEDGDTNTCIKENYVTVITAPTITIISPTTENPIYTQSGKIIQVTVKYTEQNPQNLTIRINTILEETFTDIPSGTDVTQTFNLEIPATASEAKYSLSVTLYNIYDLSSTDTEENAVVIDNTKPTITDVAQLPAENVQPTDDVKVNATITDNLSPIKNATLLYSTDNGTTWTEIPMIRLTGNIYTATIPKQGYCTHVTYKIEAYDEADNKQVQDNAGQYYVYHVIPEFHITAIMMLMLITTLIAAALRKAEFKNKS